MLEKLEKMYPIGTTIKTPVGNRICKIRFGKLEFSRHFFGNFYMDGYLVYDYETKQYAEIISYGQE